MKQVSKLPVPLHTRACPDSEKNGVLSCFWLYLNCSQEKRPVVFIPCSRNGRMDDPGAGFSCDAWSSARETSAIFFSRYANRASPESQTPDRPAGLRQGARWRG